MIRTPGQALVMGAGAVGCWVGGRLQAAGAQVQFVGRPSVLEDLRLLGLTLTDLDGRRTHLAPAALRLHAEVPEASRGGPDAPALVLLCVKSGATAEAAALLSLHLPPGTPVLSLQNGIGNPAVAAAAAPALQVIPGMVGFNVVRASPGHWHRGTWGTLAAEAHPALQAWLPTFAASGLPLALHADLRPVQWGKLLLNLNNPVNALSGLPLKRQLLDRDLRIVMAALIDEALAALAAHGIEPAQVASLPPRRMPQGLRLPNWLFRIVARKSLNMDDQARTSMAEDVARGRPTEIDALCGEVVRLARAAGLRAPCNEWMQERLSRPTPGRMSGREMRAALRL
ncbi:MAG: 2-dehydropantoate 2-reductase [Burkholderiales bacterium]|nr:2-dehydropantoate 2-reductase [Burkholderiales bacterium]